MQCVLPGLDNTPSNPPPPGLAATTLTKWYRDHPNEKLYVLYRLNSELDNEDGVYSDPTYYANTHVLYIKWVDQFLQARGVIPLDASVGDRLVPVFAVGPGSTKVQDWAGGAFIPAQYGIKQFLPKLAAGGLGAVFVVGCSLANCESLALVAAAFRLVVHIRETEPTSNDHRIMSGPALAKAVERLGAQVAPFNIPSELDMNSLGAAFQKLHKILDPGVRSTAIETPEEAFALDALSALISRRGQSVIRIFVLNAQSHFRFFLSTMIDGVNGGHANSAEQLDRGADRLTARSQEEPRRPARPLRPVLRQGHALQRRRPREP